MKKTIAFLLMAILLCGLFTGCGSKESKYIGTWKCKNEYQMPGSPSLTMLGNHYKHRCCDVYEIYEGGTALEKMYCIDCSMLSENGMGCTWDLNGDILNITIGSMYSTVRGYKLNGNNQLVAVADASEVFTKQ